MSWQLPQSNVAIPVTGHTERDQIDCDIVTQPASRIDVVNFKVSPGATVLAGPVISLENFQAELVVLLRLQPQPGPLAQRAFHAVFISVRN